MKTVRNDRPAGPTPRRSVFFFLWAQKPWAALSLALMCAFGTAALSFLLEQREVLRLSIGREAAGIPWVVFLRPGADHVSVGDAIKGLPGTRSVRFVSEDEAYDAVLRDPGLSQSLVLTGRNPFPASYEVLWEAPFMTADDLARAADKMSVLPGVDHVGYEAPRVERLDVLQRLSRALDLVLAGGLWLGAFLFLFHLGRIAFFPRGPFPARRLLAALCLGLAAGEAGYLAVRSLALFDFPAVLLMGPALSLLAALIQEP